MALFLVFCSASFQFIASFDEPLFSLKKISPLPPEIVNKIVSALIQISI